MAEGRKPNNQPILYEVISTSNLDVRLVSGVFCQVLLNKIMTSLSHHFSIFAQFDDLV